MTAIEAALKAGREAGRTGRYEPVDVVWNGRLVARVKDTNSGNEEGIYVHGSQLVFSQVGRDAGGEIKAHTVRAKEQRKVVRAMIANPSNELFEEAFANFKAQVADRTGGETRRVRRAR